jgi:hypothetical protein
VTRVASVFEEEIRVRLYARSEVPENVVQAPSHQVGELPRLWLVTGNEGGRRTIAEAATWLGSNDPRADGYRANPQLVHKLREPENDEGFYAAKLRTARRRDVIVYRPGLVPAVIIAPTAAFAAIVSAGLGFTSASTPAEWTALVVGLVAIAALGQAVRELNRLMTTARD